MPWGLGLVKPENQWVGTGGAKDFLGHKAGRSGQLHSAVAGSFGILLFITCLSFEKNDSYA